MSTFIRPLQSVTDICCLATQIFSDNPADIPFSLLYLVDPVDDKKIILSGSTRLSTGTLASPSEVIVGSENESLGWPFAEIFTTKKMIQVTGLETKFGCLPGGKWPESPQLAVGIPLLSNYTHLTGILIIGINPRRAFDKDYQDFLEVIGERLAKAFMFISAYEAEKKRVAALTEIDRAKTTFFSNISHEFRTPLTLMLGPIENMLASSPTAFVKDQHEHLEILYRNTLRLLKLVNILLDFSQIEAGRMQAKFEPVDLAKETADLASTFRSAVEHAGMKLIIDCSSLSEDVFVDREMWEKIVLNLISNAFKYTLKGEIKIALCQSDQTVILAVHDTGVGIPEKEIPHVFERFHRVQSVQGRTYEGSGIGLALVHELVKLHGGTIKVESTKDKGSIFRVTLPLDRLIFHRNNCWLPCPSVQLLIMLNRMLKKLRDGFFLHHLREIS